MIFIGTVTTYHWMSVIPPFPCFSAVSGRFKTKYKSDTATHQGTLSCSVMSGILPGGIRSVKWAGIRLPVLFRTPRGMVDGTALCLHLLPQYVTNGIGRYPLLVDAVIQSSGIGFIGTTGSTMSVLAGRRVESWYDGVFKLVKWGTAHADDH